MGIRRDHERGAGPRDYRYQPLGDPSPGDEKGDALADEDGERDPADTAEFAEDLDERPSEFWPEAELFKGAVIEDAELELSYAASIYADLPAAELRFWLRLPDGGRRLVQIDEPHAVWLYRAARHPGPDGADFEEYPDHRFELPCAEVRARRARRQRQLIDRQIALQEEIVALSEELEELERDIREDEQATDGWPGTRWP